MGILIETGQRLNAADSALLAVDRTLREMGCPGFETQMFVWLSGRADAVGLRKAVAQISRFYPVLTSRLVESEERGWSYWRFRPRAECRLQEVALASAKPEAVLDRAARLLSTPLDHSKADPIRFYLLHRPDGRDVFLWQYNHTLMDINATVPLTLAIDRLRRNANIPAPVPPPDGQRDILRAHLKQFPLERRKSAMRNTLDLWWQGLRGGAVTLGQPHASGGTSAVRFVTRELDIEQTRAFEARVVKACGFPSLSMALMGSTFRVIHRLAPERMKAGDSCVAGIGVDLGLRERKGLTFQNLVSLLPIRAPIADLDDRDRLLQMLSRQMRERLAEECDLGLLQCLSVLSKRPRQSRWLLDVPLKVGFSLWYAYFGALDEVGERFGGAGIERVFYTGPCWPQVGITLLANQFRGRLLLQVTYVPESVPEEVANKFLDEIIGDLLLAVD
jgi:hypothetical protein